MREKNIFLIVFFIIISIILGTMTFIASAEASKISARSWTLYSPDLDCFLEGENSDLRLPMASTTKIMTALVAIENSNLSDIVSFPKEAVGIEGSSVYLEEGDSLTVSDLLYSLLLRSANDAATALAITIAGDVDNFAAMMNDRAKTIGLTNTSFTNPHGLDDEAHYTTAHDLALIAAEALKNDTFKKICSTYKYTFSIGEGTRTVVNHNKLLKRYAGAIGVKTGYTKKSGRCLVSAASRDGVTLIAVTLNAPDDWADHTTLLNSGFKRVKSISLCDISSPSYTVPVIGSNKSEIKCEVSQETKIFTLDGEVIDTEICLPKYLVAPIGIGDKVGSITIKKDNKVFVVLDLTAQEDAVEIKGGKYFKLFN